MLYTSFWTNSLREVLQRFPMKEYFEASGRHKCFDYLWSQNGLRMSQISMFQLTLRKTDSERQLQTSSSVVALDIFHSTSLNISIWDPITCREMKKRPRLWWCTSSIAGTLCMFSKCVCRVLIKKMCLYKFLNELLKKSSPKVPYERILWSIWSSQSFWLLVEPIRTPYESDIHVSVNTAQNWFWTIVTD